MCHNFRRPFPFFKRNVLHPPLDVESEIKIRVCPKLLGCFFSRLFTVLCDLLEQFDQLSRKEALEGVGFWEFDDALQSSAEGNNARGWSESCCLSENMLDGVVSIE